jgi:amino acid transporter
MSEEIYNAPAMVPHSIVWSVFFNGLVGLGMYVAVLFCAGNLQDAINSPYVYPFIEVLQQAVNSNGGAAAILAILISVDLGLLIGVEASSSRMLWSFARDRGIPGWRHISKVKIAVSLSSMPAKSLAG